MSEAKVPDYDTCGLFHRLHCIKTLASRPVLICKSCYFFARKEAAGILSYSQFRFFVYFTFLFKLDFSNYILCLTKCYIAIFCIIILDILCILHCFEAFCKHFAIIHILRFHLLSYITFNN